MPAQDLNRSQSVYALKQLQNMPPAIATNNSQEQLMHDADVAGDRDAATPPGGSSTTLRHVRADEWISIFILCYVNLINYMDRFTLAGILPSVQKYYDIKDESAGFLQTSFILSYMIFAPLFGYLGDRYSRKLIMAFGVFLWSITTLIGSFMDNIYVFTTFRALVGIGEASYSTIAPTIISDLFVGATRTKMLAMFYFAIPVGSGLGYIVGSETALLFGEWQFALRVTPVLGLIAVLLIVFVLRDPERGQSEGSEHLQPTPLKDDLRSLSLNASFILSTLGFTCVAFVAGALAWWSPKLLQLGMKAAGKNDNINSLSLIFGAITIAAGIIGLLCGCLLSDKLGRKFHRADPLICACGLLVSAPLICGAMFTITYNQYLCYVLLFFGEVALNLNWAIVTDILLYVVLPTRRSTAEGVQLLVSHALGDAGSPYLIGVISESIKSNQHHHDDETDFAALQYALLVTCFVEVLGGVFFLLNSYFIVEDRRKVDTAIKGDTSAS